MAADVQVRVRVDAKETISQLDAIKQKLGAADTYANQVTAAFNRQQTAVKKLTASWAKLNAVEARASKSTNATSGTTKRLKTEYTGLNKALGMTNTKVKQYNRSIKTGSTETKKAAVAVSTLSTNLWKLNEASRAVSHMWRIILGYYMATRLAEIAVGFERAAESVSLLDKKLQHFTKEADGLEKIIAMSWEVGTNLDTLGKIITRFSVATKDAFSVNEMLSWSEGIIKSARAVGTTTQELNSGLIQLSQAMSAGRLMGDEYRSISENLPMLKVELENVFASTEHAGVGLKKLSSQGLITVDVMVQAFQALNEKMKDMPGVTDTIDANLERVKTSWALLMEAVLDGEDTLTGGALYLFAEVLQEITYHLDDTVKRLTETSDASKKLASGLIFFGEAVALAAKAVAVLAGLKMASVFIAATSSAVAFTKTAWLLKDAVYALYTQYGLLTAASVTLGTASVVMWAKILGPIGVLASLYIAWAIYSSTLDKVTESQRELNEAMEESKVAIASQNYQKLVSLKANALSEMEEIDKKLELLRTREQKELKEIAEGSFFARMGAKDRIGGIQDEIKELESEYSGYVTIFGNITSTMQEIEEKIQSADMELGTNVKGVTEFLAEINPELKNLLSFIEEYNTLEDLWWNFDISDEEFTSYLETLKAKYFELAETQKRNLELQEEANKLMVAAESPMQKAAKQLADLNEIYRNTTLSEKVYLANKKAILEAMHNANQEKEKTKDAYATTIASLNEENTALIQEVAAYNLGAEAVAEYNKQIAIQAAIKDATDKQGGKLGKGQLQSIVALVEANIALKAALGGLSSTTTEATESLSLYQQGLVALGGTYADVITYLSEYKKLTIALKGGTITKDEVEELRRKLASKYLEKETKGVSKLSDAQKEYNALVKEARDLEEKMEDPSQKFVRQMKHLEKLLKLEGEHAISTETAIKLQKQYAQELADSLIAKESIADVFNEGIDALEAETELLLAEATAYENGAEAVREFAKEKMLIAAIEKAGAEGADVDVARMRQQIDMYFEAVDALNTSKAAHENYLSFSQQFANQYKEIFSDVFGDVGENIRSLFSDVFAGTEDAFENFTDRITRLFTDMLADMAYAALVQPIIMQLQYAMSGSSAGASGSLSNSLMSGNSIPWSSLKNVLSGGQTGVATTGGGEFVSSIGPGGSTLSQLPANVPTYGVSGTTLAGVASFTGGYTASQVGGWEGAGLGTAVGAGSAALTAGMIGSGVELGALAGGSFISAASAGLAAIPVYGWAALAGSAILGSGVLNGDSDVTPDLSVWQSKKTRPELLGQDTEAGETDISFQAGGRYGGLGIMTQHDLFESQDDATEYFEYVSTKLNLLDEAIFMAIDAETNAAIEKAMNKTWLDAEKYEDGGFDIETVLEKRFDRVFDSMNNSLEGTYEKLRGLGAAYDSAATSAIIYEGVTAEAQGLLDELWLDHMGFLTEVGAEGEDFAQTAIRLAGQLGTFNSYLDAMGDEMLGISSKSVDFVDRLAEMSGGFENLVGKMNFFYANFFSESEQLDMTINQSREAITAFSEEWGTGFLTKESLRELAGAQDLVTTSGIELYNALLNIAPAVVSFYDAIDEKNELKATQDQDELKATQDRDERARLKAIQVQDERARLKAIQDQKDQDKIDEATQERARLKAIQDQKQKDDADAAKLLEERRATSKEAMLSLAGYVSVDLPTAFARGNESIWQTYDRNLHEMAALSATFDYSVESMTAMATLVEDTRQLELDMLGQIKALSESVAKSIAATTKDWLMEDMTPKEQYAYLKNDTLREYGLMMNAKDAATASEHWSNINDNIGAMKAIQESESERDTQEAKDLGWTDQNGGTDYLKAIKGPTTQEWIELLNFSGSQHDNVLTGIENGVLDNSSTISDGIAAAFDIDTLSLAASTQMAAAEKIDAAADDMVLAAERMNRAAGTPVSLQADFTLSESSTEVGGY